MIYTNLYRAGLDLIIPKGTPFIECFKVDFDRYRLQGSLALTKGKIHYPIKFEYRFDSQHLTLIDTQNYVRILNDNLISFEEFHAAVLYSLEKTLCIDYLSNLIRLSVDAFKVEGKAIFYKNLSVLKTLNKSLTKEALDRGRDMLSRLPYNRYAPIKPFNLVMVGVTGNVR